VLAVVFTFFALTSDLLYNHYNLRHQNKQAARKRSVHSASGDASSTHLGRWSSGNPSRGQSLPEHDARVQSETSTPYEQSSEPTWSQEAGTEAVAASGAASSRPGLWRASSALRSTDSLSIPLLQESMPGNPEYNGDGITNERDYLRLPRPLLSDSRRQRKTSASVVSTVGHGSLFSTESLRAYAFRTTDPILATGTRFWAGCTLVNISKGLLWSLAITGMHYIGIWALQVPNGACILERHFVILSAFISWFVCVVGAILMAHMEMHIGRQLLFAVIATVGVATMHFTGRYGYNASTSAKADRRAKACVLPRLSPVNRQQAPGVTLQSSP